MDAAAALAAAVPSTLNGLFAMLAYLPLAMQQQASDIDDGLGLLFGGKATVFTSLAEAAKALSKQGRPIV